MRAVIILAVVVALGCRAIPTTAAFDFSDGDGAVGSDANPGTDVIEIADVQDDLADLNDVAVLLDGADATDVNAGQDATDVDAEQDVVNAGSDGVVTTCDGKNCDDGVPCTIDSCNATSGCVHTPDNGKCVDNKPCTSDFCNASTGCLNANMSGSCDDGDACTTNDTCSAGICKGSPPVCGNGKCECAEDAQTCPADCVVEPLMVSLPAGTFLMGSPAGVGNDDEHPQHQVTLSAFQIDKSEVTVAQYTVFYNQLIPTQKCNKPNSDNMKCAQPGTTQACNWGVVGKEQHPINCVDWFQASAYCQWAHMGGRLPTEAEWEYAARSGGKAQIYPWGDAAPTCSFANYFTCNSDSTAVTCSHPSGNSSQGACDLAGNGYEWCWDWQGAYSATAQTDPIGPYLGNYRVLRGGGWEDPPEALRAAMRYQNSDSNFSNYATFRCVRTL